MIGYMTFSRGKLSTRGTSVLAALVMVAVLCVLGYGFSELRNSYLTNTQALAAQAATAAGGGIGSDTVKTAQDQAKAQLAQKCATAISQAKTSATETASKNNVQDDCVAAIKVTDQATVNLNGGYKCVGKSGSVLVKSDGTLDIKAQPNANVEPGKCKVVACQPNNIPVADQILGKTAATCAATALSSLNKDTILEQINGANAFTALRSPGGLLPESIKPTGSDYLIPQTSLTKSQLDVMNAAFGNDPNNTNGYIPLQSNGDLSAATKEQLAQLANSNPDADAVQKSNDITAAAVELNSDLSTAAVYKDCSGTDCIAVANNKEQADALIKDGYSCGSPESDGTIACSKNKTPSGPPNPGPGTAAPGSQQTFPPGNGSSGNGSGGLGALSSILSGLAKGLAQSGALAPQAACTGDQTQYQQQLQQYQYQMQQYQYQMQLYNQQQQLAQYNGNAVAPLPPTMPSQPCYNANAAQQCTSQQPAQPSASQCSVGTWKPLYSGQCIANWQCVPGSTGTGVQPTAQLSCQPSVADVGTTVSVGYSCINAASSQGNGFDTGGALSGTSTVTIQTPPQGANTATYGITCVNGTLTATQQCSIQISQPSIILVANPQTVNQNDTTTIGWVTSGMQSCVVSSPEQSDFTVRNENNTSINGVASSSPITVVTHFVLTCQTLGGNARSATTTVSYPGAPNATSTQPVQSSITVNSTADGTTANHGDSVGVTWQTASPPTGAAISLWLIDVRSGNTVGLISGGQPTSGSYTWKIPATTDTCDNNSPAPCAADLVPGRDYDIEAALYTPSNAYLGGLPAPANPVDPQYVDYNDTTAFTVGN